MNDHCNHESEDRRLMRMLEENKNSCFLKALRRGEHVTGKIPECYRQGLTNYDANVIRKKLLSALKLERQKIRAEKEAEKKLALSIVPESEGKQLEEVAV